MTILDKPKKLKVGVKLGGLFYDNGGVDVLKDLRDTADYFELNSEVYGHRGTEEELVWNRMRTQFHSGVKYIPLESNTYVFGSHVKARILKGQSQMKSESEV